MTAIPGTGNLIDVYRLHYSSGYVAQATPDAPFGLSWRTEKNGTGTGTFTIPLDDSAYGDIGINDVAAIRRDGTTVAALVIEQIDEHLLDADGGAKQVATYTGRLAGVFLDWAIIAPALGAGRKPIEEDAVFDWRSPRYDDSLDAWVASNEIMTVFDAESGDWPHQPMAENYDLTTGSMMILDSSGDDAYAPFGWYLFRRVFTITDGGRYAIESLMDDLGLFWVDGLQQLDVPLEDGFVSASFKRLDLSAGTHLFTWAVFNLEDSGNPGFGLGPAALAYNLYKADLQDRPLDGGYYEVSDSSTEVLFVGEDPWPGMTVGDILIQLLDEAQARGTSASTHGLTWLAPSFDAVDDSNGDPWPREPGTTTKTGTTTLLAFMDELVASGRVAQWRIRPDGVTWDAFAPGYTSPTAVTLDPATATDPLTGQLVGFDRKIT